MPINEEEGHTDGVAVVTFAKANHAAEALKVSPSLRWCGIAIG